MALSIFVCLKISKEKYNRVFRIWLTCAACFTAIFVTFSCGIVGDGDPAIHLVNAVSRKGYLRFHLQSDKPLEHETVVLIRIETELDEYWSTSEQFILFFAGRVQSWVFEIHNTIDVTIDSPTPVRHVSGKIKVTILPAEERLNVELPKIAWYKGNFLNRGGSDTYEEIPVRHRFQPYKVGQPSELFIEP